MTWTIETIREAPVAPTDVFQLYADPSAWSTWGHAAQWARTDGPFLEGAVVEVKPPLIMTVIQTYVVEPTPSGSRIRHALEIWGPLAGATRLIGFPEAYQRRLDKEVWKVIEMAGRPGALPRPMPTTEPQPTV